MIAVRSIEAPSRELNAHLPERGENRGPLVVKRDTERAPSVDPESTDVPAATIETASAVASPVPHPLR
jgi:hypothetical protein